MKETILFLKRSLNYYFIGIVLVFTLLGTYYVNPSFLIKLEYFTLDFRFLYAGERSPSGEVAIAAIDEKSIDGIGRWPWPRSKMAEVVDALTEYKVKVLGFDVVFSSKDESSGIVSLRELKEEMLSSGATEGVMSSLDKKIADADYDERLRSSLKKSRRAVLGYFFHFSREGLEHLTKKELEQYLSNISKSKYSGIKKAAGVSLKSIPLRKAYAVESSIQTISSATKRAGFFNFIPEIDGGVRKVPLIIQYQDRVEIPGEQDYLFIPLSIATLKKYLRAPLLFWVEEDGIDKVAFAGRETIEIPTDKLGAMWVNYLGPRKTFPHYSIIDILERKVPPNLLKGKIVLMGPTATAIEDLRVTPFDKNFPGVEVHATIIDNILQREFLNEPEWVNKYNIANIVFTVLLLTALIPLLSAFSAWLFTFFIFLLQIYVNLSLFAQENLLLNLIYPLVATVSTYLFLTIYKVFTEEKQKRYIQSAFGQYLSPQVIKNLVDDPDKLQLGGERKVLTAFFSDVEGFSTISEKLSPDELVELLNIYLTEMTNILLKHNGTVDKYEGDAIIAFFGAPVPFENHAYLSCLVAVEMQERLHEMRLEWLKEGKPELKMRIGLNTGPMVVGNMGSQTRMDYTMMGDSVNLAARLEGVNKQYHTYSMISEYTYKEVEGEFECRELDLIRVMGKSEPVRIYELIAVKGNINDQRKAVVEKFAEGLDYYKKQQWDDAIAMFQAALEIYQYDGPSQTFYDRCVAFKDSPPPEGWDGVYEMKSK